MMASAQKTGLFRSQEELVEQENSLSAHPHLVKNLKLHREVKKTIKKKFYHKLNHPF